MRKTSQRLAGARCQVRLKMRNFYMWLLVCGFAREILCTDAANEKQSQEQNISTISSNDNISDGQSYTEENKSNVRSEQESSYSNMHRFSRSVPSVKTTSGSTAESKPNPTPDYVLKIPLSVLRQYAIHRLLEQSEEFKNDQYTILRLSRSNNENDYDIQDIDKLFQILNFENENFIEDYLEELFKEKGENNLPLIRNSRSMLLLTKTPKLEETTNGKTAQKFILPYPRPGRSDKFRKGEKSKHDQLILPYPRPGRSEAQKSLFKELILDNNNEKYIVPTTREDRSSLKSTLSDNEDGLITADWISPIKSKPLSQILEKEFLSKNTDDKNEENSFFVIPYPRPGKRALFKLKDKNQNPKNSDKEIADYVLPYPRPGKKSTREKSTQSKGAELFYHLPEKSIEIDNFIEYDNQKEFLRKNRNSDSILPYPRPGRSIFLNDQSPISNLNDISINSDEFQASESDFKNLDDSATRIFRFKRSSSVVPYSRLGRSNAVLPYARQGRSNVLPYTRPGRSNSVVPYPRIGLSNSLVPYPRPGRSNSVVPYPRIGRSDAVVPYPRVGRSTENQTHPDSGRPKRSISVVPYPRLGRSDSVVPYPRFGRAESVLPYPRPGRAEFIVPYPRPGRAESVVPYPRPGRSESVVPYPRPGRAESVVPYPRPGRAESIVPYPRPGRAESVVPYPRPGRAESVVPYPRPGRAESIVPYPRSGKSVSVLPYPRLGRSLTVKPETFDSYENAVNLLLSYLTPDYSNFEQSISNAAENPAINLPFQMHASTNNLGYDATSNNFLSDMNTFRENRATNGQGYVLPHPRVGRSTSQKREERESSDTDTVIPYPRLGRSQKETIPIKSSPENLNSVHKLNKHVLSSVEDSVYLLPYPRPGRHSK